MFLLKKSNKKNSPMDPVYVRAGFPQNNNEKTLINVFLKSFQNYNWKLTYGPGINVRAGSYKIILKKTLINVFLKSFQNHHWKLTYGPGINIKAGSYKIILKKC